MSNFLFVTDDDQVNKINIDDLYEKEKEKNLKQLSIFNKILNRIHKRINITSRNKRLDKHIWFNVPEYIFGETLYDKGDCIAYVVLKLRENGFEVTYVHPNTLFICWKNWIPNYVRNEFRKKTGKIMNETGEIFDNDEEEPQELQKEPIKNYTDNKKDNYVSTNEYRPTGKFIYNPSLFDRIEKKMN